MKRQIWVLGEALMDCMAQSDGSLRPLMGGSPFNMARAAALRGADVVYANPLSTDNFGVQLAALLTADGVKTALPASRLPTSLAVVQIKDGQPSYGFYREGIADRDYSSKQMLDLLAAEPAGVLHTGSLHLVPPESEKLLEVIKGAKALGWTISVDVNLRPKLASNLAKYVAEVETIAALADWIKASDEDLELLGFTEPTRASAESIARKFRADGASRIALTFGGKGAWLDVDGANAQADVPVVQVVDTVGAGDTFWGNCVGDWVINGNNASDRVAKTLHEAMQAAAINCTRNGCQPPRYSEIVSLS